MPSQTVSQKVKRTPKWQHSSVDGVINMATAQCSGARSPRENKISNYDLINSRFNEADFNHVLNPYNVKDKKFVGNTSKLRNMNIIRSKIEALKGEEMKLGLNYRAVAINGRVTLEKNKEMQDRILTAIQEKAMALASNQELAEEREPEKVADKFSSEYEHPLELAVNNVLKFLTHKDMLQMKFSKGWEHSMSSAEEIYYTHISDGHPAARVCNPINVEYDADNDEPFIHKGMWAREERMVAPAYIIDLHGDELSKEEVRRIMSGELGGLGPNSSGMQPGFGYEFGGAMKMGNTFDADDTHNIYYANVTWRSVKRVGYLSYTSPRTGQVETTMVNDSFKIPDELKAQGATIRWSNLTDIWKGTRIGNDIYVDCGPLENQTNNLPYVGYRYNSLNSQAVSLVDLCKPVQYLYIIVWFRLEEELAKAKGKKFIMDLAQLPKSKGWTVDQWMYYFDNMGVAWINSMEEGRKNDKTSISNFSNFNAVDMTLSQTIGQYMDILSKLEAQIESITGVNKQREGDIGRHETATGANRAIIQSSNTTRPYFYYHDITRKEVLNNLMELAKVAYQDGIELEHIVDEKTIISLKLAAGELNGVDFGVFLTDSFEEAETLEKIEQYLGMALQSNVATLSDVANVLGSKSVSEVRSLIVESDRERQEREKASAESQQASQEKVAAEAAQALKEQTAFEKYKFDTEVEKDLTIAAMAEKPGETDADRELKEAGVRAADSKSALDKVKVANDKTLKEKELSIKSREVSIKSNMSTAK